MNNICCVDKKVIHKIPTGLMIILYEIEHKNFIYKGLFSTTPNNPQILIGDFPFCITTRIND